MKYFFVFLSLVITLLVFILFLLFTQSGNNMIKPYIEKEMSKKLQQDVNINAFTLKTNFIDIEANINKVSTVIINGNFDMFKKSANLDYTIDAKNLKTPFIDIDGLLNVKGHLKGKMEDFIADGTGVAFNSKIDFLTHIQNQKPKEIRLKAKNIKIEKILAFFKKPIYSKGMIDIDIDVKPKPNNTYFGKNDIIIHYGTLNNLLISKDFGVKFTQIVTYRGNIKSTIYGEKIHAKSNIISNIANIETKDSQYDLNKERFYSDYSIHIPKLSAFEKTLQGDITLDGNIQKTKEDFSFNINSKTLGGNIKALVFNKTIKVDAKNIKLSSLSKMLTQPNYSDGKLNFSLDMKNGNGNLSLRVKDASLNVRELIDTKKADKIDYKLTLNSNINQNDVSINSQITSDILDLDISKSNYNLKDKTINGIYALKVTDLNNLYFLTKRPLKGALNVKGNYAYIYSIYLDGNSSFLDAETSFILKNGLLNIKSNELSLAKVSDVLYYPKVFDSFSTLEANYNLNYKVGTIRINALNGKLLKSKLTSIIHLANGFDLTAEVYKDSLFRGVIDKKNIDFSLLLSGLESYLKIPNGYLNLETNEIDSEFNIKIEHRDFKGTIQGSLDSPNVELIGSEYLKQKLNKEIEKNIKKEWQDVAKELLKLFG